MIRLPGTILVVDDHAPNRELLAEILGLEGYSVLTAQGGGDALAQMAELDPDLVLLDVNMPGMNGLEVCRRLRADPRTAPVPIILVTSLSHREQRLEGIAAGANDYLTKPVDRTDLLLRVRNALSLRKLHRELAAQYEELRRMEQLRDDLVHMLVHDLRSPLTGISCTLDLIHQELPRDAPSQLGEDIEAMRRSVRQMAGMVTTVLDVSRLEAKAMPLARKPIDLAHLMEEAIASQVRPVGRVMVRQVLLPGLTLVVADREIILRVIANLLHNAVKFSPAHGEVIVEVGSEGEAVKVRVSDTGPGVPPEHQEAIFEKFGQVGSPRKAHGHSTGLGLTFCKLAVEAHGGRIGVESSPGMGCVFWFTLPAQGAAG